MLDILVDRLLSAIRHLFGRKSQKHTFCQKKPQKLDEFGILCLFSAEKSYEALSGKIFRLSAEF